MNNFNLKKFLVENKITQNSKLFEADDFEFTDADKKMAINLNAKILKIGDTITPEMLNPDDQDYEFHSSDSWTIEDIYNDEGWVASLRAKTKTHMPYSPSLISLEQDIEALNDEILKPQYYIEIPDDITSISDDPDYVDDINEADDDFEFTDLDRKLADQLSGLTIGDTITPDMWDKQKFETNLLDNLLNNEIYNETIQNSYVIKSIYKSKNDWFVTLVVEKTNQLWDQQKLSFLNSLLKDKYTIVGHNMNEADDDFEFTDLDRKLAKGLSSSYIIIKLINEYTFSEGGDGITLYEVKTIETTTSDLAEILQLDIPYDKNSLEILLKNQYFENDDLMDFLNEGEITQAIPDEYYGDDWDIEWEGFDIKVILS